MASRSAAAASAVAFAAASSLTAASPDCAAAFHVAVSCRGFLRFRPGRVAFRS